MRLLVGGALITIVTSWGFGLGVVVTDGGPVDEWIDFRKERDELAARILPLCRDSGLEDDFTELELRNAFERSGCGWSVTYGSGGRVDRDDIWQSFVYEHRRAGWPFRALEGKIIQRNGYADVVIVRGLWLLDWRVHRTQSALLFHVRPFPFAANTLTYALGLGALFAGARYVLRSARLRRGRCPICGYDLRGSKCGSCPECGH